MFLVKALARGLLDTFCLKQYLSRRDFIVNCLLILALIAVFFYLHNEFSLHIYVLLSLAISLFLWFISLSIRRLHDLNMSAWWLLFPLVTGGGFYLIAMIVQSFLRSNLGFMYVLASFVQIGVVGIMFIILLQAKSKDNVKQDK